MLKSLKDAVIGLGQATIFFGQVLGCILRGRIRWAEVFKQIHEQGVQSLVIVMLAALASGAVLAMQSRVAMERFGAKELIAQLVALSLVRELGPVFTALVFSGKSGAGMAAELGTMSVNNQIQATRTLGVDPIEFLVVPRMLGCFLVLPLLVVIAEVVGIFGGFLVIVTETDVPASYYIHQTINAVGYTDFFTGFVKVYFFSLLIGWICCFKGFFTSGGSLGVGRFTTQAVALSYIAVIVANTFLTKFILTFWGN